MDFFKVNSYFFKQRDALVVSVAARVLGDCAEFISPPLTPFMPLSKSSMYIEYIGLWSIG